MFVVLIGWMIFYFEDFSAMKSAFSVAFGASGNAFTDPVMNAMIINNIPFIIIAAIACAPIAKLVKAGVAKLKQRAPVTEPIFNTVFNVVMLVLFAVSEGVVVCSPVVSALLSSSCESASPSPIPPLFFMTVAPSPIFRNE